MDTPLVTVVIPVYNMEDFLPETLRSVLSSDYPQLEIIVVDDGSRDGSLDVALEFAHQDNRITVISQPNAGVAAARNRAISVCHGELIFPVDADNTIEPSLISQAVSAILADPEVKVVAPQADFFGTRQGLWKLPPFSLHLLAHKNIMDTCALYYRKDWEKAGGYCEYIVAREDWEFWISVLKDGGKVVRLKDVGLHYRVREQSKRVSDRQLKRHVIDTLNYLHPEFFKRELGGPLRYHRSWSVAINKLLGWQHHSCEDSSLNLREKKQKLKQLKRDS